MALQKLVCNVDETLLKLVDEYAELLHITRTAAVSVLLSQALRNEKLYSDLGRLMDAYDRERIAKETAGLT